MSHRFTLPQALTVMTALDRLRTDSDRTLLIVTSGDPYELAQQVKEALSAVQSAPLRWIDMTIAERTDGDGDGVLHIVQYQGLYAQKYSEIVAIGWDMRTMGVARSNRLETERRLDDALRAALARGGIEHRL